MKTIMVVSSHTDDEALGCGGTIAKLVAQGNQVHLLFMTNGVGSRKVKDQDPYKRLESA